MHRIAIVYISVHHKNTEAVVRHIAPLLPADVFDLSAGEPPEFSEFDTLIFASGIYFNRIHSKLRACIAGRDLSGKRAIPLYTCGLCCLFPGRFSALLRRRGASVPGKVSCRGLDTFGPLAAFGGIAKKHPSAAALQKVRRRLFTLLQR